MPLLNLLGRGFLVSPNVNEENEECAGPSKDMSSSSEKPPSFDGEKDKGEVGRRICDQNESVLPAKLCRLEVVRVSVWVLRCVFVLRVCVGLSSGVGEEGYCACGIVGPKKRVAALTSRVSFGRPNKGGGAMGRDGPTVMRRRGWGEPASDDEEPGECRARCETVEGNATR